MSDPPSRPSWQRPTERFRLLRGVCFFEDVPHLSVVNDIAAAWLHDAPVDLRYTDAGTVEEFLSDAQDIAVAHLQYNQATFADQRLWDEMRLAAGDSLVRDEYGELDEDTNAAEQFYAFAAILASHRSSVHEVAHAVRTFHTFNLEALIWLIQGNRLRGPTRTLLRMPLLEDETLYSLNLRLIRCISCSTTSQVFLAARVDTERNRLAIAKVFHPSVVAWRQAGCSGFEEENSFLETVKPLKVTPTVVRVDAAAGAIVFRYRKEVSARELYQNGHVPATQTLRLMSETLRTLAKVHQVGIVHAAVSPDHLLIRNSSSGNLRVLLCDWQAALRTDEQAAADSGAWQRCPLSASPHILRGGTPTQRCDIYALGLTFLELLSGASVFCNTPLTDLLNEHQRLVDTRLARFEFPTDLREVLLALLRGSFCSATEALEHPALKSFGG